ncbi:MAG TPA: branched-chain amino acid ABC transporter permease [Burkholderiales bacterium]|nr:branched-chain amino acid ABC transporter permease [Burkholderiales bacterium]
MDLATFAIQLLNAVQYGLLLFLIAAGLTLVFGIMGIINLAHGAFYMVGAYLAWSLSIRLGSLWLAIPAGIVLSLVLGLLLEWLLIRRVYRLDHLQQVLLTYGLILIVEETRSILWGDEVHSVPVPDLLAGSIALTDTLSYPVYRLGISAACLVVAALLYGLIRHTRLGMTVRAGATNREMVQSLGIDVDLLYRFVFALGVALAAFAGMVAAPASTVFPGMGNQVLILSFVVVVIGGLGSVKGALVAALLIGLVDTFGKVVEWKIGSVHLLPELAGMSVYVLMAIVLLWRPAGLFAEKRA